MRDNGSNELRENLRCTKFVRLLAHLAGVVSLACSAAHPAEVAGESRAALLGGSISPAERDAVVFIRANHPDGSFADCTGTLLSPRVAVTAKHCVTLLQPGEFVCSGAGTLVEDGQGGGIFGAKVEGTSIEIYTGTAPVSAASAHVLASFTSESGDACHDDIAALVLDTPIQQPSYPALRAARPVRIGESVRLVGYGTVSHEALIERREIADVRVIDVGRDDGVLDPKATTPARSFVVAGGTACFGDSGGPALSMESGALVGVYSRITGDCYAIESRNAFILASSFTGLFERAFSQAGEQPRLEPSLAASTGEQPDAAATSAPADATDSSTTTGDAPSTTKESTRRGALRCALQQSSGAGDPLTACWFLLALLVGFSRRCFGVRLS